MYGVEGRGEMGRERDKKSEVVDQNDGRDDGQSQVR